jgi:uncharacterized protein YndB with AHSA1/START domain
METMEKVKIELEYILHTTPSVLYKCIGSASGLSEWFADNVNFKEDTYTFYWDGSEEVAQLLRNKKGESVRFQWEKDEDTEYYFEMTIVVQPLTSQVALIVTDFAEADEVDDVKLLWENSMGKLRQIIGG